MEQDNIYMDETKKQYKYIIQQVQSDLGNVILWAKCARMASKIGKDDMRQTYDVSLWYNPRSYKLWDMYSTDAEIEFDHEEIMKVYRRATLCLGEYPGLWIKYIKYLDSKDPSKVKEVLRKALMLVPVTQHEWLKTSLSNLNCMKEVHVEQPETDYKYWLISSGFYNSALQLYESSEHVTTNDILIQAEIIGKKIDHAIQQLSIVVSKGGKYAKIVTDVCLSDEQTQSHKVIGFYLASLIGTVKCGVIRLNELLSSYPSVKEEELVRDYGGSESDWISLINKYYNITNEGDKTKRINILREACSYHPDSSRLYNMFLDVISINNYKEFKDEVESVDLERFGGKELSEVVLYCAEIILMNEGMEATREFIEKKLSTLNPYISKALSRSCGLFSLLADITENLDGSLAAIKIYKRALSSHAITTRMATAAYEIARQISQVGEADPISVLASFINNEVTLTMYLEQLFKHNQTRAWNMFLASTKSYGNCTYVCTRFGKILESQNTEKAKVVYDIMVQRDRSPDTFLIKAKRMFYMEGIQSWINTLVEACNELPNEHKLGIVQILAKSLAIVGDFHNAKRVYKSFLPLGDRAYRSEYAKFKTDHKSFD